MRYFDATKYFGVKMTRQAKVLIIPSFLSIKGEELSAIFCNVVTIKRTKALSANVRHKAFVNHHIKLS